jgi:hypothetical protein
MRFITVQGSPKEFILTPAQTVHLKSDTRPQTAILVG